MADRLKARLSAAVPAFAPGSLIRGAIEAAAAQRVAAHKAAAGTVPRDKVCTLCTAGKLRTHGLHRDANEGEKGNALAALRDAGLCQCLGDARLGGAHVCLFTLLANGGRPIACKACAKNPRLKGAGLDDVLSASCIGGGGCRKRATLWQEPLVKRDDEDLGEEAISTHAKRQRLLYCAGHRPKQPAPTGTKHFYRQPAPARCPGAGGDACLSDPHGLVASLPAAPLLLAGKRDVDGRTCEPCAAAAGLLPSSSSRCTVCPVLVDQFLEKFLETQDLPVEKEDVVVRVATRSTVRSAGGRCTGHKNGLPMPNMVLWTGATALPAEVAFTVHGATAPPANTVAVVLYERGDGRLHVRPFAIGSEAVLEARSAAAARAAERQAAARAAERQAAARAAERQVFFATAVAELADVDPDALVPDA